jgi:hypothetical protein
LSGLVAFAIGVLLLNVAVVAIIFCF